MQAFEGHLALDGRLIARAGFMPALLGPHGLTPVPSVSLLTRALGAGGALAEAQGRLALLERSEGGGDVTQVLRELGLSMAEFQRAITSTTSNLPIRENLEAEAKILIPTDTPLRNRLPRIPGSSTASAWRQATGLGGGYGGSTTVTTGASSATQTVGSTAGMQAGDTVYFGTTAASRIVSSVTNATTVVLTATISTTTAETVTKIGFQPGGGAAIRSFYAETGAPADHVTTYAAKSAAYKLMGTYGSVTSFAMAAGRNFQPQLVTEKRNALTNLMLNEENALINGSSTSTAAPWGDGSNALAFDGLLNLITTANGTPVDQVQTAVGALTTAHLDAQLSRLWNQGARGLWMLVNEQEARSMAHLAEATGSIIRLPQSAGSVTLGKRVITYTHPVTSEDVEILPSRFLSPGTIIFGSTSLPDGSPTMDVSVLQQTDLPSLAADNPIQGYTARDLAPSLTAPDVFAFMISVYEVLRLKSAFHVAVSKGITAV